MNLLTVPIDRAATNLLLEKQTMIVSGSTALAPFSVSPGRVETAVTAATDPTREASLSATDFRWAEALMYDVVYLYQAASAQVALSNVDTWVVQTVFTPPTESHFRNRILQAKLPAKWILGGVQPPTAECRSLAYKSWKLLYTKFGILPMRVSASVEGGITLYYEHASNGKTLIAEIYNDLEVAALVNDSKKIVYSENIKCLDFDCAFLEFNV